MNPRGELLLTLKLFCRVYPLERPRLSPTGHIYQPWDKHKALLNEMEPYWALLAKPIAVPVVMDCTIRLPRGSTKAMYPIAPGHGDEDNLRKTINDCLVRAEILKDDRFVIGGETWKLFGDEPTATIQLWSAT